MRLLPRTIRVPSIDGGRHTFAPTGNLRDFARYVKVDNVSRASSEVWARRASSWPALDVSPRLPLTKPARQCRTHRLWTTRFRRIAPPRIVTTSRHRARWAPASVPPSDDRGDEIKPTYTLSHPAGAWRRTNSHHYTDDRAARFTTLCRCVRRRLLPDDARNGSAKRWRARDRREGANQRSFTGRAVAVSFPASAPDVPPDESSRCRGLN